MNDEYVRIYKEQVMVRVFLKRIKKFRKSFSQYSLEICQNCNQY